MERAAKLLVALGLCACLAAHAASLALLFYQHNLGNGCVSALILFFGTAAAKAFFTLRYSARRKHFATVPKLCLANSTQLLLATLALAIATLSLFLALHALATAGPYKIPTGAITFCCALFYLLLLLTAFTVRKKK